MAQLGYLPQIGETIDRYTVLAELAHGGMAAVYAVGRSTGHFNKLLAMKVMLPHLVSEKQFVDMFVDEARIAAHVQHPNVVQVFDVGDHKGTPYMVMEYLSGQSLSTVRRRIQLSAGEVLELLARAAEGLHAAHETRDRSGELLNIVHRDVSPQNIHVSYDGSVKVVDFGIAAASGRITQTRTGEVKGKLSYAAPEQLRPKREVDRRLDIWAMGVIAWEMLSGKRLFKGETDADTMYNVLNKIPAPLGGKIPAEVAELVASCLERNVDLRPTTAAELARVFGSAASRLGADRGELAARVSSAFAEQRAVEEERIASALGEPRGPARESETSSAPQLDGIAVTDEEYLASLSRTDIDAPKTTGRMRWLAIALLMVVGVAGVLAMNQEPAPSEVEAETTQAEIETEAGSDSEAEAVTEAEHEGESEDESESETETQVAVDAEDESEAVEASPMRVRRGMRTGMHSRMTTTSTGMMSSMDLMPVTF